MSRVEIPQRVLDRIWDRIDVRGPDECWPWRLSIGSHGYGQIGWRNDGRTNTTTAHHAVWVATHGQIECDKPFLSPGYTTIDHTCFNRRCCNPAHLRLLTNSENAGGNRRALNRTHCPHGHEYTPENTIQRRDVNCRVCRTCKSERAARWYQAVKQKRAS